MSKTPDNSFIQSFIMNSSDNMTDSNETIWNNSANDTVGDIIQIALFILVFILSNIHVIIVLSQKNLRINKFNWLTMSVCFASAFFAFIQILSTIFRVTNTPEAIISCRSKGFLINMATCHIMYTHCTASFCRLLSVRYPHKLIFRTWYWLLSNIIMSWLIGIVLSLPYLFLDGFACSSNNNSKRFLQIYSSFATILLPIIVVTICNIMVFRYVRQSTKRIQDINNNNNTNQQLNKRDLYLWKVVLLTFCIFVIGWTPIFIEQLFLNPQQLPSSILTLFRLLPPASLLADFFVLIYSDQPVRTLLLKILQCHRTNHV